MWRAGTAIDLFVFWCRILSGFSVMADWLKVNHALVRSPKVRGLMRALHCKKHAALGLAVSWLCWIDEQTTDGQTGLLPDELDDEIGFRGCAEALIAIGWAALGADGCVYALEFGKHCGESAKGRAEGARRVAKCKANKKRVTAEETEECNRGNEKTLPKALPEKNRIDISSKGEHGTTVDIEAAAVPGAPARDGFFDWLAQIGQVVPMLQRLNLDHPLPRVVEDAARRAAGLVRLTPECLELLRRYYAAESVTGWRPDSLERFFTDLPDVLQHAANWCQADDRRRRKAAARERARAQAAAVGERAERSQEEADDLLAQWRKIQAEEGGAE